MLMCFRCVFCCGKVPISQSYFDIGNVQDGKRLGLNDGVSFPTFGL